MKKIIALFAVLGLAACSGDDDNDKATSNKYPDKVTLIDVDGSSEAISFIYDSQKHIKTIAVNGEVLYDFDYDGDNIIAITADGDETPYYKFQYTNGIFSGYGVDDEPFAPVSYNAQNNSYNFTTLNAILTVSGRDFAKLTDSNSEVYTEVVYDSSKKGALYNVAGNNLFVMTYFSNLYPYVSTQAVKSLRIEGPNEYSVSNTYDSEGYVTQAVLTPLADGRVITVQYTYKAL